MRTFFFTSLLGLLLVPAQAGELLRVWNMDAGVQNDQGGFYNHFAAGGSDTTVQLVGDERRGSGGRAMKITYKKQSEGYCGVWTHLFAHDAPQHDRVFLDVEQQPFLSLWVKGAQGGEDFTLQMADPSWLAREDSSPAGLASDYLGNPLTTDWQEIVVPWSDFRLPGHLAAGLTLNFTEEGQGTVFVDDIYFKATANAAVPVSAATAESESSSRETARVLWVWETSPILLDPVARHDFFSFCSGQDVNELFFQLIYAFDNEASPDVTCEVLHPQETRSFLRDAHARGIRVHALDGHPTFVRREKHDRVLAQVRAVLDFNENGVETDRFCGVHHDNEPYLLPAFESPAQEQILSEYLELNDRIMTLVRARESDLVYGVDMPFWYDERSGPLDCRVTYNGERKDVARHIIDIVDNAGIMDYRNFAGGADGMIVHGATEVDYGAAQGKHIYLGAETYRDQPTPIYFVYHIAAESWPALVQAGKSVAMESTFDGFRLWHLESQHHHHLGLAEPASPGRRDAFERALIRLASVCETQGGASAPFDAETMVDEVNRAIRVDGVFNGYDPWTVNNDDGTAVLSGFSTTAQMLEKVTFAGKTRTYLNEALREVENHFRDNPGFAGVAIHYYKTFRDLPE